MVAIFGKNSRDPMACCIAAKAVGPTAVTEAAHDDYNHANVYTWLQGMPVHVQTAKVL